ncbi:MULTISPECIES: antitoxin [Micrococcales]|uniref:antitoxin n=1 Tax=Micrococcales TaxID=85006 RepID=UPI000481A3E9|nr:MULTISPECIES: antitoxin [Micrococcales]CAH0327669.1 hypothetical protein SRABI128_06337 [Microbacterium sp. Bi128]
MGLLDDLKGKAQQVIGGNEEAIKDGIEKAGDFVDSKTGGKHAGTIDAVQRGASDFVDKANDRPNSAPVADQTPAAGEPPVAGEPRQPGL